MKENKRVLQVFIHVIGWGIIFCFPLFFTSETEVRLNWYLGYFFVPVSFMLVFYTNYLFLIDKWLFNKKLWQFVVLNVLLIFCVEFCLDWWMNYHFSHFMPESHRHPGPPKMMFVLRDYTLMILVAALSVAIKMTGNWYRTDTERRELEKGRTEAELKNLKSQLNPHFLFNTLNNIYSLISFSPEKAQHAVHDLSRLLRYVLYDNNQHFVPLMKEMEFVNNYIALMKIRLPKHVKLETEVYAEYNVMVAPLLFITLIENAFKHGVSPVAPSFIYVGLSTEEDNKVICHVENSLFPKDKQDKSGSGIGLENLRKRLELLYPNRYVLKIEVQEERYVADLQLQVEK